MRDYGKVHTSFWSSSDMRSLSEDARALALYLLTCPHGTIAGVFRLPDGYACEDLQWGSERVSEGFSELLAKGFANRCETTKWVWIFKHFEWNSPENPNQKKAAAKVAMSVPDDCVWKLDYMRVSADFLGIENEPLENSCETVSEPFPNPSLTSNSNSNSNNKRSAFNPKTHLMVVGVSEKVATDWLSLRKTKKAAATLTAIEGIQREAEKVGYSLEQALRVCCERGWQGFKADWVHDVQNKSVDPWEGAIRG